MESGKTLSAHDRLEKLPSMVIPGEHTVLAVPTVSCLVAASPLEGNKVTEKQQRGGFIRGPSNTVYL